MNDVFSRVKILSYPCWLGQQRIERGLCTADYQLALRLAFLEWGLPERLATDHDRIFFDQTNPSPFPTQLQLWLVALGIDLQFGRLGRPTDQGMTERSHQLWTQQVLDGPTDANQQALWQACQQRRTLLNEHFPCASLGNCPPLQAHPEARFPRQEYRLEWESEMLDLQRVYRYLALGRWARKVTKAGVITIGGHPFSLGTAFRKDQYVRLTFDPVRCAFLCHSFTQQDPQEKVLPIHWLTKESLMGEIFQFHNIPVQLALPYSFVEWRVLSYAH